MPTATITTNDTRDRGQRHRDAMARRSREQTASASDIGKIPAVVNSRRRNSCRLDLRRFLRIYFPASTGLSPFSEDHIRVIDRIQSCVIDGGRFVNAVYRGFAKTTISENAAIWAVLYGHRRFVPIFGANADAAKTSIDSIKLELAENDLLMEDFPEVCHAVREIDGKVQRCRSQTYASELTHIGWTAETIVLPTIPGSVASGAIITTRGITGGARGMKHKRPDGTQQRPDCVFLDDIQTDESAASPLQIGKILSTIRKSILKLGGHQRQIAAVLNATVIEQGDVVDQLLDPSKNPAWQGERIPMVRQWAGAAVGEREKYLGAVKGSEEVHDGKWLGEYARLRNSYAADVVGDQQRAHAAATKFYRANRKAMDAGCIVSWPNCYDRDREISAIQHAYNALIDDGAEVFASEFQQQPMPKVHVASDLLTAGQIATKVNGLPRGIVPLGCEHVVAFADVQGEAIFWVVAAFGGGFTGAVIDYGTLPDQQRLRFSLGDIKRTLSREFPGKGPEAARYAGMDAMANDLAGRVWARQDGAELRIERLIVDAGFDTQTVELFCRQTQHAAIVTPSHGRGIKAGDNPMSLWAIKPGERRGTNWILRGGKGKATRAVIFDANWWKSFVHSRLAVAMGDKGCLSLWGKPDRETREMHGLFSEHLTAEARTQTEGRGRTVEEWRLRAAGMDNHWLDCLVGAAVAASMCGVTLMGEGEATSGARKKVSVPKHVRA